MYKILIISLFVIFGSVTTFSQSYVSYFKYGNNIYKYNNKTGIVTDRYNHLVFRYDKRTKTWRNKFNKIVYTQNNNRSFTNVLSGNRRYHYTSPYNKTGNYFKTPPVKFNTKSIYKSQASK